MQVNEKKVKKVRAPRVGRPGLTNKLFWIHNEHNTAVFSLARKLAKEKDQDVNWETALEYLIETHPQTKKLMPL